MQTSIFGAAIPANKWGACGRDAWIVYRKNQVVAADILGNLVDGQAGISQIKTGLIYPLEDHQLFGGTSCLLFDAVLRWSGRNPTVWAVLSRVAVNDFVGSL